MKNALTTLFDANYPFKSSSSQTRRTAVHIQICVFPVLPQHQLDFPKLKGSFIKAVMGEKTFLCICEKVSTHVSLRSSRRLTWAEAFRYRLIFCILGSKTNPTSWIVWIHN